MFFDFTISSCCSATSCRETQKGEQLIDKVLLFFTSNGSVHWTRLADSARQIRVGGGDEYQPVSGYPLVSGYSPVSGYLIHVWTRKL